MKSTYIFSTIYAIITFCVLNAIMYSDIEHQFIAKIFLSIILLSMYLFAVKKENVKKLYVLMLLFVGLGQIMFIFIEDYFYVSVFSYFSAHIVFSYIIYKKYLKKQSLFDIITFSLPFIFVFSVAYVLFDINLDKGAKIIITGLVACLNASLILLNYANTRNVQNYLFFMGLFIWLMVDALSGVYMYSFKEEIFYLLAVMLDVIAQYMICRAFMLDAPNKDDFLNF